MKATSPATSSAHSSRKGAPLSGGKETCSGLAVPRCATTAAHTSSATAAKPRAPPINPMPRLLPMEGPG